jgi:hypothetical protein
VFDLRKLSKNNYFKTIVTIVLIVAITAGFFLGMQLVLGTSAPLRVVESGSMCVPYDGHVKAGSHKTIRLLKPCTKVTS